MLIRTAIFLIFLGLCISCDDGNNQIKKTEITVDAFIRAKNIGGVIKYAPILVAKSNLEITSATATNNAGTKYDLISFWDDKKQFRWVPKEKDYVDATSFVSPDTYTFIVKTKDDENDKNKQEENKGDETKEKKEKGITDEIDIKDIPPPFNISEATYYKERRIINIVWDNGPTFFYVVRITSKENEYGIDSRPIFQSKKLFFDLSKSKVSIQLSRDSLSWYKSQYPKNGGSNCVLSVHSYKTRSDKSNIAGEFVFDNQISWDIVKKVAKK